MPPAKPHRAPAPLRRPAALDAVGDGGSSTYGLAYAIAFQAQVERFEAVHGKLDGADRPAPARPPLPAKRSRFAHWITAGQARVAPSVEITMDVHDGRQSHDAGHVLGWDQHHVLCGVQKAGGDIELRMLPAAQIPRVTSEALQAVQATNARRAGYASRVCSATDFVPAVFKREGKRPREEKVLHIVNGALNGCSVNEPMQRPQVSCEGRQHKPWAECRRCRCGMILDRKLLPAAHQFPDRVRKSCGVGGRTAAKQSERRAGGNGPE